MAWIIPAWKDSDCVQKKVLFSGSNLSKGREMLVRPRNSHAHGPIWGHFGLFGPIWGCLRPFWAGFWPTMAYFGPIWGHMPVICGNPRVGSMSTSSCIFIFIISCLNVHIIPHLIYPQVIALVLLISLRTGHGPKSCFFIYLVESVGHRSLSPKISVCNMACL